MISPFNIIKGELGRNFRSPNYTKTYTPSTVSGLAWSEMRGAWSLLRQRLASAWSEMRWGSGTVWTTVGQRLDKMGRDSRPDLGDSQTPESSNKRLNAGIVELTDPRK